jgi:glycosyltransferase involved in cell wall biosynthesis
MMPKVTIGICVRNNATTIREAIESIIAQDYAHELMEVIFVDDGSEDKTLSIINSYIPKMNMKVKVFHHEWKGLGASRNVVVNNAEGKYIIWVDGDMILPPSHIRTQVEFMEKNPKVGVAKAKYGIMIERNIVEVLENIPFVIYDSKNVSLDLKLPGTGGAIYRVEAIRQVGGFDEKLKGAGEDQDAAFRIKNLGWLIKRSPAVFYERRSGTWSRVWLKWAWYGSGDYDLYCKNRSIFSLFKMNPLAGFVNGLLLMTHAYRLVQRRFIFLLPFHMSFQMTARCIGFVKGQISYYRQRSRDLFRLWCYKG